MLFAKCRALPTTLKYHRSESSIRGSTHNFTRRKILYVELGAHMSAKKTSCQSRQDQLFQNLPINIHLLFVPFFGHLLELATRSVVGGHQSLRRNSGRKLFSSK